MSTAVAQDPYTRWRSTIPFTDAQIAEELEVIARRQDGGHPQAAAKTRAIADHLLRTGHLSRGVLSTCLQGLVRHCAICGVKALYRVGYFGYCRRHKDQRPAWWREHVRQYEVRSEDAERERRARDYRDLSHLNANSHARFRHKG